MLSFNTTTLEQAYLQKYDVYLRILHPIHQDGDQSLLKGEEKGGGGSLNENFKKEQYVSQLRGTHCTRCPDSISLQMGCSARVSQNSQASRATFSSGSWVRCSMYCRTEQHGIGCQDTTLRHKKLAQGIGLSGSEDIGTLGIIVNQ